MASWITSQRSGIKGASARSERRGGNSGTWKEVPHRFLCPHGAPAHMRTKTAVTRSSERKEREQELQNTSLPANLPLNAEPLSIRAVIQTAPKIFFPPRLKYSFFTSENYTVFGLWKKVRWACFLACSTAAATFFFTFSLIWSTIIAVYVLMWQIREITDYTCIWMDLGVIAKVPE